MSRLVLPVAREAARLLGAQIRSARRARGWSVQELAERAEVSDKTIRKVEQGSLSVAVGTVFDCAALAGVTLFYDDERRVADEAQRRQAAVIGRRTRAKPTQVDLDF